MCIPNVPWLIDWIKLSSWLCSILCSLGCFLYNYSGRLLTSHRCGRRGTLNRLRWSNLSGRNGLNCSGLDMTTVFLDLTIWALYHDGRAGLNLPHFKFLLLKNVRKDLFFRTDAFDYYMIMGIPAFTLITHDDNIFALWGWPCRWLSQYDCVPIWRCPIDSLTGRCTDYSHSLTRWGAICPLDHGRPARLRLNRYHRPALLALLHRPLFKGVKMLVSCRIEHIEFTINRIFQHSQLLGF